MYTVIYSDAILLAIYTYIIPEDIHEKIFYLLVLLVPVSGFSDEIYDFITLQGNLANGFYFNAVSPNMHPDAFQEEAGFAVGAKCEMNLGKNMLWHIGLAGAIPLAKSLGGPKLDVGLSYILSGTGEYAEYFSFFFGEDVDITVEGKCKANFITALDFGSRIYAHWYLSDFTDKSQKYGDVALITDNCSYYNIMGYAGIRYVSVYEGFMPIQEVDVAVHGLVGFVIHDSYYHAEDKYPGSGTDFTTINVAVNEPHLAFGGEVCLKWYIFEFIGGYYDSNFYMEANLLLNVVFF
ncbi:MAG: hypothetical protein JW969_08885 [Spirochaetales bacterium]|nr:hypothetical protein [Spirochaetales bacterium]